MEIFGIEFLPRVLGALGVLIAAWIVNKLIKKGQVKLFKAGALRQLLIGAFGRVCIYLIAIGFALWILDIFSLWIQFQSIYPLAAKLVQVAVLWFITIWVTRVFSNIFSKIEEKAVKKIPAEVSLLFQKLFKYGIYGVAVLLTLGIFGLLGAIQGLLVAAGFAGIVIGFAAKDVLSNLLAGISLMIDRPFKIGDWIHLKEKNIVGYVKSMSLRSITIVAPDNTPINIPNSLVDTQAVINYSAHRLRRFFLKVGISYESDVAKAIKIIRKTLEKDPAIVKEGIRGQGYFAPIEIVVTDFGDSSVNLEAKVFIDTTIAGGLFETKSRMLANIKEALTRGRVEIPYPRRYVILHKKKK